MLSAVLQSFVVLIEISEKETIFEGGNNQVAASLSEGKACFTIKMQNKNMVKTPSC